ncbi:MAG TPA: S26 family signal peptidase [Acidimicrobiaceae bacterium]|nr:S26 family signal peptidase [Actinomycetota bacterium]HAN06885.1 S26 family signal peptidase [Acidimicrobiaceae bacterium]
MEGSGRLSRIWLFRRFLVTGQSMSPTFNNGDGVIAIRSRRAIVGQVRVARNPNKDSMWLLKRVSAVGQDGMMSLSSDSNDSSVVDSRTFGRVLVRGSFRVFLHLPANGKPKFVILGPRPNLH